VVTHRGCKEPYQLHCWAVEQVDDTLEATEVEERLEFTTGVEEREVDVIELEDGATDERTDEGAALVVILEETTLDATDEAAPQIEPVTAGVSIAPPLAFTCTPNDTFCPGWIVPFQFRLVAE
jgi:hypothetical protein